jgi:hypothetical protein
MPRPITHAIPANYKSFEADFLAMANNPAPVATITLPFPHAWQLLSALQLAQGHPMDTQPKITRILIQIHWMPDGNGTFIPNAKFGGIAPEGLDLQRLDRWLTLQLTTFLTTEPDDLTWPKIPDQAMEVFHHHPEA